MLADDHFKLVADFVVRISPMATEQLDQLRQDLAELLIATGATDDGTEAGTWFRRYATVAVDHATLARQFNAISNSDAPLDHTACTGPIREELYAAARREWRARARPTEPHDFVSFRDASAAFFASCAPKDLGELARDLGRHHQSFVRRKRPAKSKLDTLLEELGDIYACITNDPWHRHHLAHSVNSRFVQFCRLVIHPFFDPSEVTLKAISRRWKRLKDQNRKA